MRIGIAEEDITPPLEVGLLTSSVREKWMPFETIRMNLKARVLIIGFEQELLALVSLDLLGLTDTSVSGWQSFKECIAGAVPANRIIITCTHTHNAPESVSLTDLYTLPLFNEWLEMVKARIRNAIERAASRMCSCTLTYGSTVLENYSLQRRVPTKAGVVNSDSLQPIAEELFRRQPIDNRIKSMRFLDDEGLVVATIVHAVCHPVHEMCMPHVSPDFPGELCKAMEESGSTEKCFFINGAAGDINPPTVSMGSEYAKDHGVAIAIAVKEIIYEPLSVLQFRVTQGELKLDSRKPIVQIPNPDCTARINAIRIGPIAIVFLPGEPFLETALEIENASSFVYTLVAGYSENSIGYVPPDHAISEGGYEAGPGKWSYLEKDAEGLIKSKAIELLEGLE